MSKPVHYYNTSNEPQIKSKWWSDTIPSEKRHEHIFSVVRAICQKQSYRTRNNERFARLYHNMELVGLDAGMYARTLNQDDFLTNRVTLNCIKSCVDTVTSKIAKSKPRPYFLTEDGDWEAQVKAKGLTLFMDGWMDGTKTYAKGRRGFTDSTIFGTGVLKLYKNYQKKRVESERVICEEIVVDDVEGMYGDPRQLHQKKNVFREVLVDAYPEFEGQIMQAPSCIRSEYATTSSADMITVLESWHLPSGDDAKDGRHTISIETATLLDEPYTKDYFPFVFQRWTEPTLGFYGLGLAEELIGIQLEINKILRNIQIAQHLLAVPQVWLEYNSKVVGAHINNEIGGIKRYVGTPPIFMVPQAMSPEVYAHLESLYRKAFEITGVSAMAAKAEKPAGVTAAVALEALSDIETERFMVTAQRYEESFLDTAFKVIDMTRDMYVGDPGAGIEPVKDIEVPAATKEFMEKIKWKDVDLPGERYVMRCYPTNLLPTQPAGKLQRVQELMQAGFFDREDAMSLLDYPDISSVRSRMTGARDEILKLNDLMLRKGRYISPEPYMNLELGKRLTQAEYNKAKVGGAPESRLELLQRFMDDCDALIEKAKAEIERRQMEAMAAAQGQAALPAPGAAPADAGMAPVAQPEVPPTSELMPVTA